MRSIYKWPLISDNGCINGPAKHSNGMFDNIAFHTIMKIIPVQIFVDCVSSDICIYVSGA